MSGGLIVLRQGDPILVLSETQDPIIVERDTPTAISIENHGTTVETYGAGNGADWGTITGNIEQQADLQAALTSAADRSQHTGTQPIESVTGLRQELDTKLTQTALPTRYDGGFF